MRAAPTALTVLAATALGLLAAGDADALKPAPEGGGAPQVSGVVTTGGPALQVRRRPGAGRVVARIPDGTRVPILCQASGPEVAGPFGRSRVWDKVRAGGRVGFVSDSSVFTGSDGLVAGVCGKGVRRGRTKPGRIATESLPLIVRRAPRTGAREVGRLAPGTRVRISCQTTGAPVQGTFGTSTLWNRITQPEVGFVPDAYVFTGSDGRVARDCKRRRPAGPKPEPEDQAPGGGPRPGQAEQGRCTADVPFGLEPAPASREQFVAFFGDDARRSDRRTKVPGAVTLGQGILESGAGAHTAGANNYFGIKAASLGGGVHRWGDEAVGCVLRKTREVIGGRDVTVVAAFRLYRTAEDSFVDHGEFLAESSRYRPAFGAQHDSREFVRRIAAAGYATDPNYAPLVISLMDGLSLYRFDVR